MKISGIYSIFGKYYGDKLYKLLSDCCPDNSEIQDILNKLPSYPSSKEAFEDGKPIGYWFYSTFYNTISKVAKYIKSYSAGISMIDFHSRRFKRLECWYCSQTNNGTTTKWAIY